MAEELWLSEEHEYTTERAQKSSVVKPLPKPFLLQSKQSFVQRIFEDPIQMGGMRLDSLLPLKHLQQTSLVWTQRHHHPHSSGSWWRRIVGTETFTPASNNKFPSLISSWTSRFSKIIGGYNLRTSYKIMVTWNIQEKREWCYMIRIH